MGGYTGVKIASNAFEWKFEHLLPNYWYPVVKRKLEKPETATLKDKGIAGDEDYK